MNLVPLLLGFKLYDVLCNKIYLQSNLSNELIFFTILKVFTPTLILRWTNTGSINWSSTAP